MRRSGILMHISSLPSPYGIGTFGSEAYRFVDFLHTAGQAYWQILPITPVGYGNSPYSSPSAYAINPYFIDLDMLADDGWIDPDDLTNIGKSRRYDAVDFESVAATRLRIMSKAYSKFAGHEPKEYAEFCDENSYWIDDYALYMSIVDEHGASWRSWPANLRDRDAATLKAAADGLRDRIGYYKMQQFFAASQWHALKKYANGRGVKIIGDMPIYVATDSVDVWSSRSQFLLDEDGNPTEVAGCPPDAFSADGQLWGNPLYDWNVMARDGYDWWCRRIKYACDTFDMVRIDHFRAFDEYYAIPADAKTAADGTWRPGPRMKLFDRVRELMGDVPLLAEDLGLLNDSVRALLKHSGFPGMAVLQFAFSGGDSEYLPHNHRRNQVVYTGTHDNDTVLGWEEKAPRGEIEYARRYLHAVDGDSLNWAMIRAAMSSVADTAIIPIQDYCCMGSDARMNTPSTVGENWCWRIGGDCINDWLAGIIRECTALYCRLPK